MRNPLDRFKTLGTNKKKILKNVFWALLGKAVNMAGALFVGILVARYLGPSQYGMMNYVISYVALFTVIATFGLSNIEVRELAKRPEQKEVLLGTCFRIRFFFSTVAYLLIILTLFIFRTDLFTSLMILLYGVTLYSQCCFEVIRNYFTSIVKNEYIVKSEITRTIIGACIKLTLLWLHAPLWCFVAAVMFDTVLVASGYVFSYNKTIGSLKSWTFDRNIALYLVKQSFPLVLSGAAIIVYQRIDQVMIGNMIDKESVGYFATAGKFLDIILFLPTVLTQTVTPLIVKIKTKGTEKEYKYKSYQFISIVVWVAIILAAIVSVSSYWLIYITYGTQYLAAVPVLQIMAWKTVGMAISSAGGQLIIIEQQQKWAVIRNIAGCIACVCLNLVFIPAYGIVGSAWVTILTLMISGFGANVLIPPYHHIFKMECKALICGWYELKYLKSFIKI